MIGDFIVSNVYTSGDLICILLKVVADGVSRPYLQCYPKRMAESIAWQRFGLLVMRANTILLSWVCVKISDILCFLGKGRKL